LQAARNKLHASIGIAACATRTSMWGCGIDTITPQSGWVAPELTALYRSMRFRA
jgi:hypothetical protein